MDEGSTCLFLVMKFIGSNYSQVRASIEGEGSCCVERAALPSSSSSISYPSNKHQQQVVLFYAAQGVAAGR
jgi:hypothetical protein